MENTLLIADDNEALRKLISAGLRDDGYRVIEADDGPAAVAILKAELVDLLITDVVMPNMDGIELLERAHQLRPNLRSIIITGHGTARTVIEAFKNRACDIISKPFKLEELKAAVHTALETAADCDIEVLSATPEWIEARVPCDLEAIPRIVKFLSEIETTLPPETRDAIASAFREMLTNAIEHGGKCDPNKRVDVKYVRLKRAVLYSIRDPGEGFDIDELKHAALTNPATEPLQHMRVRQQMGLRPGGYGILMASQVIDELVYNEKHNELIFVKYLEAPPAGKPE